MRAGRAGSVVASAAADQASRASVTLTARCGIRGSSRPANLADQPAPRAGASAAMVRPPSDAQLRFQELVDLLRVALALRRLHDLPDEEAEQLVLAGAVLGDLAGILAHHLVDGGDDGRLVGYLCQPLLGDDLDGRLS